MIFLQWDYTWTRGAPSVQPNQQTILILQVVPFQHFLETFESTLFYKLLVNETLLKPQSVEKTPTLLVFAQGLLVCQMSPVQERGSLLEVFSALKCLQQGNNYL